MGYGPGGAGSSVAPSVSSNFHCTPIFTLLLHAIEAMAHADLIAIESYREMIAYLGDRDPTTHRMLEVILASEEEHADDLSSLLEDMKN